ncbi:MAG: hypothetical protein Q8L78_03995 [Coxiellaceae bacterium]|nr:hypothetical protein [Coxiellaceae bacterium]
MLKNSVVVSFLLGFSLQVTADSYTCFRCITAPVHRTQMLTEVTTCDLDRVIDLQYNEHYHCEKISPVLP